MAEGAAIKASSVNGFRDEDGGGHAALASDPEYMPHLWEGHGNRARANPVKRWLLRKLKSDAHRGEVRIRVSVQRLDTQQAMPIFEGVTLDPFLAEAPAGGHAKLDCGRFRLPSTLPAEALSCDVWLQVHLLPATGQVALDFLSGRPLVRCAQAELDTFFDECLPWPSEGGAAKGGIVAGCAVQLCALVSRPDLNGCGALVLRRNGDRFAVFVPALQGSILVKPACLQLAPPPPWQMLDVGVLASLGLSGTTRAMQVSHLWAHAARSCLESWRQLRVLRSIDIDQAGALASYPQLGRTPGGLLVGGSAQFRISATVDTTVLMSSAQSPTVGNDVPPTNPADIAETVIRDGRPYRRMRRLPLPRDTLGDIQGLSGLVFANGCIVVAEDGGRRLQRFELDASGRFQATAVLGAYGDEDSFQHQGLVELEGKLFTVDVNNDRVVAFDLQLTKRLLTIGDDEDVVAFSEIHALAASNDTLYVVDCGHVRAFTSSGTLLRSFVLEEELLWTHAAAATSDTLYLLTQNDDAGDQAVHVLSLNGKALQQPLVLRKPLPKSARVGFGRCMGMCIKESLLYVTTDGSHDRRGPARDKPAQMHILAMHQLPIAEWRDFIFDLSITLNGKTMATWHGATLEMEAFTMKNALPTLWKNTPKWYTKWLNSGCDGTVMLNVRVSIQQGNSLLTAEIYASESVDGSEGELDFEMIGLPSSSPDSPDLSMSAELYDKDGVVCLHFHKIDFDTPTGEVPLEESELIAFFNQHIPWKQQAT